jgi:CelD/BcsL family acetyltransferase involved in cellulose biosynthesis
MGLSVRTHEDPRILWDLTTPWEELWAHSAAAVPFLHPLWVQTWWNHYGTDRRLMLVTVWDKGERLLGLAPLCQHVLGNGTLDWVGGVELADSLDFLMWEGMEPSVLRSMEKEIRSLVGDAKLSLHYVPDDSSTLSESNKMLQGGWNVELTLEESSPCILLPRDWEEYLQRLTSKDRHELRRKMRRMENELDSTFRVLQDEDGWQRGIEAFFRLHRLSQLQKARFMTKEREAFFLAVGLAFLKKGWLRLSWLEAGGEPIAAAISFVYRHTWGLYNSGYDPRYGKFSPGIVLVARTIERAMKEGLEYYDFLRGREEYKYRFGARDRDLFHLRLWPCREGDAG